MQKVIRSDLLIPLIEDSYRSEYTEWDRRNLRFSDAGIAAKEGDKCERQVYYDIYENAQKTPLSSGSLVLFDDGRLHEADIRRRLRSILRSPEKEVNDPELGARGKIDNTIYLGQIKDQIQQILLNNEIKMDINEDPGLEIKTVNQFQYQEMAASGQVLQNYYDQIQMYLWVTGKAFFVCLIKNRNSMGNGKGEMPYLEFIVLQDVDRQNEIRGGMKVTKQAIDQKIIPPRPFLRDSTQCQFCRFKYICWPQEEAKGIEQPALSGLAEPTKEILESAIRVYNQSSKEISVLNKAKEEAAEVIKSYFRAVGPGDLVVGNLKATYSRTSKKTWDLVYLKDHLTKDQLIEISDPSEDKLKALIADRQVDALVLEEGLKVVPYGVTLRVTEAKLKESDRQSIPETKKEEEKDDKRIKPGKKMPKAGISKARGKSTSTGERKCNAAKGNGVLPLGSSNRKSGKRQAAGGSV